MSSVFFFFPTKFLRLLLTSSPFSFCRNWTIMRFLTFLGSGSLCAAAMPLSSISTPISKPISLTVCLGLSSGLTDTPVISRQFLFRYYCVWVTQKPWPPVRGPHYLPCPRTTLTDPLRTTPKIACIWIVMKIKDIVYCFSNRSLVSAKSGALR